MDVMCAAADTTEAVDAQELLYVTHAILRAGSEVAFAALLRILLIRSFAVDLRLIGTLVESGAMQALSPMPLR